MTIGKPPHRPAGKADKDNERMSAAWQNAGPPHDASRNDKARKEQNLENRDRAGGTPESDQVEDYQEVGGSRPGAPSLVKDAIARRESREEE